MHYVLRKKHLTERQNVYKNLLDSTDITGNSTFYQEIFEWLVKLVKILLLNFAKYCCISFIFSFIGNIVFTRDKFTFHTLSWASLVLSLIDENVRIFIVFSLHQLITKVMGIKPV